MKTAKHPNGIVEIKNVPMTFDEWVEGMHLDFERFHRPCRKCGAECHCTKLEQSNSGIHLMWRCEEDHVFLQDVSNLELEQMYNEKKPTKLVHEVTYPGRQKIANY